jgi:tetratricopeptide (TPR) repeat protein
MSKRGWPHVDDPSAVGSRLKEARLAAGLSQRELSFQGCTAVYICRIERGDRVPSLQVLRELARRVGVEEDYLATGSSRASDADQLLEADVALRLDQFEVAGPLYAQALERGASPAVRARALAGLGQIDLHSNRVAEGIARLEAARDLLGERIAEQPALVDALARAYSQRGEYESAIGLLEHSLKLVQEDGDEQAETRLTVLLANVLIDSGRLPRAQELLRSSIEKAKGAADPMLQARLYWSQSRLRSGDVSTEAAARNARMALASIELTESVEYAATAHNLLARIELQRGNAADALDLLERGHELAMRMDGGCVDDRFRIEKARALAALGRGEEAVALATEAANALTEGRPEQAGRAYAIAADVHAGNGDAAPALELYERAAELAERHPELVREIYAKMAELLEQEGRKDEALELLKRAVGTQSEPPEHA